MPHESRLAPWIVCTMLLAATASVGVQAGAAVQGCTATCRKAMLKEEVFAIPEQLVAPARLAAERRKLHERAGTADAPAKFAGEVDGEWDDVDAYFTFPYFEPSVGDLDILIRGFPAVRSGTSNVYTLDDWDRNAYWLEMGTPYPPRMLQSLDLVSDYVPVSGELFFDSAVVVSTCTTPAARCTLNYVPHVQYRQSGVVDESFEELAMVFVTDGQGDAIDALVLIEDGNGEVIDGEPFSAGDAIKLNTLGYRMDEPEYIYALEYMDDFAVLDTGDFISLSHHVPGSDFEDPDMLPEFDAADVPIRLVLDASIAAADDYDDRGGRTGTFAYGGPFPLGFTWGDALDFVHRDGMEALRAATQAPPAAIKSFVRGKD